MIDPIASIGRGRDWKPLEFSYDETRDQMTIEGRKYSADFFRFFADHNDGRLFRFVSSNDDGVVTIQTLDLATAIGLLKSRQ
jgi:hypothetical protein